MAKKSQKDAFEDITNIENAPTEVQVEAVKAEDYISPPVAARTRRNKGVSPSKIPRRILPKDNEALAEIEQARALLNEDASDLSDSEKDYAEEVSALTNEELRNRLKNLGINVGPVVESTRKIYEKKLVNLMSKAESGFSTDDNDEATPVGAEVEEPPKVVRRTRKKASEDLSKAEPVENFSDDDDIPIVQNTSSRRRSARVAKKESKAAVDTPETVQEEPASEEKPKENGDAQPAVEEQSVEQVAEAPAEESVAEAEQSVAEAPSPSGEEAAKFAAASKFKFDCSFLENLPVHTILVVVFLAMFMGLIWHQRDAHAQLLRNLTKMATYYYTQLYKLVMPGVEDVAPAAEPVADN